MKLGILASALLVFWALFSSVFPILNDLKAHRALRAGDMIPDVVLSWVGEAPKGEEKRGQKFRSVDYEGKVLVLDFWASWCRPCMKMVPHLNELAEAFSNEVVIVGVNREPGQNKKVAQKMTEMQFEFSSVMDRRAGTKRGFGEKIGLQSLPTTVIVGKSGRIHSVHLGLGDAPRLKAEILRAIQE